VPLNATVVESSDLGLAAWSLDPATCIVSAALATTVQYLAAVYYKADPATSPLPSRVLIPNGVAGTSSIIQAALINMDQLGANAPGTVLATSPASGTAMAAGLNSLPLTYAAAAPAQLPQGRYWIGLMNTTGTTTTCLASSNPGAGNLGVNVGADAAHTRFGIAATTGAFPASIVVASIVNTVGAGLCLCAALA
jgi:hypothetical protein